MSDEKCGCDDCREILRLTALVEAWRPVVAHAVRWSKRPESVIRLDHEPLISDVELWLELRRRVAALPEEHKP